MILQTYVIFPDEPHMVLTNVGTQYGLQRMYKAGFLFVLCPLRHVNSQKDARDIIDQTIQRST